ncbi:MAG TPA: glucosaminidase domain-containing protein [Polyangiaceae bacterium]|jgi:hypothetical protein|nr:glucosaminidase domain-containing protein [Polyangiaceae bacterium]
MTPITSLPELTNRTPEASVSPQAAPGFQAALGRTRTDATTLVKAQRTPLSGSEAAQAIESAWTDVMGEPPSKSTVAVLTAQWAHETGRGRSMLNYNFGGIKGTGPSGLSASYGTKEGWGASEVHTTDTFRAYRTPEEGAKDYVQLLAKRFPKAVEAAKAGDPDGFVRGLKERGYFTGNEVAYRNSVASMSAQALEQGFDAVSTPGSPAAANFSYEPQPIASRDFRETSAVPFDPSMARDVSVDPAAFYDEIARASLRIAADPNSESRDAQSIL